MTIVWWRNVHAGHRIYCVRPPRPESLRLLFPQVGSASSGRRSSGCRRTDASVLEELCTTLGYTQHLLEAVDGAGGGGNISASMSQRTELIHVSVHFDQRI